MPHGTNRTDNASADQCMPRHLWATDILRSVADYFQHLRDATTATTTATTTASSDPSSDSSSDSSSATGPNSHVANQAAQQPAEPDQSHQCPRHTERTCNCSASTCADDDCGTPDTCLGCKPFACARHDPTSHYRQNSGACGTPHAVGDCA